MSGARSRVDIMKNRRRVCSLLLSILSLVPAVFAVNPGACPSCKSDHVVLGCECVSCKDARGYYLYKRNGRATCRPCSSCDGNNLIQVTACTEKRDRTCHCKPGFYCNSPSELTCRRNCIACTNGFTSTPNLNRSCQAYTDCTRRGMVVIKEGSPTEDRVCGPPKHPKPMTKTPSSWRTTFPRPLSILPVSQSITTLLCRTKPRITVTSSTPEATTHSSVSTEGVQTSDRSEDTSLPSETVSEPTWTASVPSSSQNPVMSLFSNITAPPVLGSEVTQTQPGWGHNQSSESHSKTTWVSMLLLLVLLCVVLCLCLKCESRAIKNKLKLAGLAFPEDNTFSNSSSTSCTTSTDAIPNAETLVLLNTPDTVNDQARSQGSFPGNNQHVTMEHVGRADGINNTVGSIFIYSPGMVVLGSNSSEKKEEAETSGEDTRLMSVPQQESSCEEDFIRLATQEELGKELSIPVPATSK